MDELTRFARHLAERLAARAEGPAAPVTLAELRRRVLPYSVERRALGLGSIEDYETVLLRLVAGERGYVTTLPPAAATRCREELEQPNPDLGVLEELAESLLQPTSLLLEREPTPAPAPRAEPAAEPAPAERCPHCRRELPSGRAASFCPWCGRRVVPLSCPRCGTELDAQWRHCITCGSPVEDPFRPS